MGNGGAAVNGVELIALERERQQTLEGYSREHDEAHKEGEIVDAARAYLDFYGGSSANIAVLYWPWDAESFKPGVRNKESEIRCLQKAGALIAAEIDRRLQEASE